MASRLRLARAVPSRRMLWLAQVALSAKKRADRKAANTDGGGGPDSTVRNPPAPTRKTAPVGAPDRCGPQAAPRDAGLRGLAPIDQLELEGPPVVEEIPVQLDRQVEGHPQRRHALGHLPGDA